MRVGIGIAQDPDPSLAAVRAVRQARRSVRRPDLALAFGGVRLDQQRVHRGLCDTLDPATLIGGSSYAEVTNAGVSKDSVGVLLLDFEGAARVRLATARDAQSPYAAGQALVGELAKTPRPEGHSLGLILSAVSTTGHANEALRALRDGLGPMPVFGGMASGDYDLGTNDPGFLSDHLYAGPALARNAVSLALLDLAPEDLRPAFGVAHGWDAVGPPVTLTRCQGNKVYEVDGMPVFDYYRQFLGREASDRFFGQMIHRYAFSLLVGAGRDRRSLLKAPFTCDFEDRSITYHPAEELQDREVQLIQASRKGLVEGAREAAESCLKGLRGEPPSLVFMVSCCARSTILHSRMDLEVDAVRSVLGREAPIFGYYAGGEIAPLLNTYEEAADSVREFSGSFYHTTTVCLLALGGGKPSRAVVPRRARGQRATASDEARRLRTLLAQSEDTLDSIEGFMAGLSRKSYQDGERLKRQNEVIHRYTPHQVWSRVGESVARGEYELADHELSGAFLFMDVKGFTAFSESRPAAEVVRTLNAIFSPATRIIYECGGDVDKFIGDCIFAAFPDARAAAQAACRVLKLFDDLDSKASPFAVRIGINAGRAVRANVGSPARREYTFIGDAVNLAQRLESNATPGRILAAEAVWATAKDLFAEAERKELTVKGRAHTVIAYECRPA
jgi:class 3 adenylate cyclase